MIKKYLKKDIYNDARGTNNTNDQIKVKTSMLKSSLFNYSDAHMLVSGTITITRDGADDNAKDIDVVLPMYNLIEHSDNYSKTSRSLWQYYRDEPNATLTESKSLIFKERITRPLEIAEPLKQLSNFWRNLEMPLIN